MTNSMDARLIVRAGIKDPGVVVLKEQRYVLGRANFADIAFENPYVSREHAEIWVEGDNYFVKDLGSKNGTFVDGDQIENESVQLRSRSDIELGKGQVIVTFQRCSATMTLTTSPEDEPDSRMIFQANDELVATATAGLVVDESTREVLINSVAVNPPLSRKEFDIIAFLYKRVGQACSKDEIAEAGWPERPDAEVSDQEITQCVHRIRRRLDHVVENPEFIESIRGFGYRLNVSPATKTEATG
ncbi:MAG: FHA domain-containing protein [Chloroflexi bacterium]|nr:FHA domain-containing protein [Chloroflexota bacterium]